jgi:hypothetical protein
VLQEWCQSLRQYDFVAYADHFLSELMFTRNMHSSFWRGPRNPSKSCFFFTAAEFTAPLARRPQLLFSPETVWNEAMRHSAGRCLNGMPHFGLLVVDDDGDGDKNGAQMAQLVEHLRALMERLHSEQLRRQENQWPYCWVGKVMVHCRTGGEAIELRKKLSPYHRPLFVLPDVDAGTGGRLLLGNNKRERLTTNRRRRDVLR